MYMYTFHHFVLGRQMFDVINLLNIQSFLVRSTDVTEKEQLKLLGKFFCALFVEMTPR